MYISMDFIDEMLYSIIYEIEMSILEEEVFHLHCLELNFFEYNNNE